MLNQSSLDFIRKIGEKYAPRKIILFGSYLGGDGRDIDLAVEGLGKSETDSFWDDLMWADELGRKPVDLIRIEDAHWLNPIIFEEGAVIYEAELQRRAIGSVA